MNASALLAGRPRTGNTFFATGVALALSALSVVHGQDPDVVVTSGSTLTITTSTTYQSLEVTGTGSRVFANAPLTLTLTGEEAGLRVFQSGRFDVGADVIAAGRVRVFSDGVLDIGNGALSASQLYMAGSLARSGTGTIDLGFLAVDDGAAVTVRNGDQIRRGFVVENFAGLGSGATTSLTLAADLTISDTDNYERVEVFAESVLDLGSHRLTTPGELWLVDGSLLRSGSSGITASSLTVGGSSAITVMPGDMFTRAASDGRGLDVGPSARVNLGGDFSLPGRARLFGTLGMQGHDLDVGDELLIGGQVNAQATILRTGSESIQAHSMEIDGVVGYTFAAQDRVVGRFSAVNGATVIQQGPQTFGRLSVSDTASYTTVGDLTLTDSLGLSEYCLLVGNDGSFQAQGNANVSVAGGAVIFNTVTIGSGTLTAGAFDLYGPTASLTTTGSGRFVSPLLFLSNRSDTFGGLSPTLPDLTVTGSVGVYEGSLTFEEGHTFTGGVKVWERAIATNFVSSTFSHVTVMAGANYTAAAPLTTASLVLNGTGAMIASGTGGRFETQHLVVQDGAQIPTIAVQEIGSLTVTGSGSLVNGNSFLDLQSLTLSNGGVLELRTFDGQWNAQPAAMRLMGDSVSILQGYASVNLLRASDPSLTLGYVYDAGTNATYVVAVPEPAAITLVAVGLGCLAIRGRRRMNR